jgi:hypothetical protein
MFSSKYVHLNPDKAYVWSGHGGSIFNRERMLQNLQRMSVVDDILDTWQQTYSVALPINIGTDCFLSLLTILCNGTVGTYKGYGDCAFLNTSLDVQHQYKVHYGCHMPEVLAHLVTTHVI